MARQTEIKQHPKHEQPRQTFEALAIVRGPGGAFEVLTLVADESMVVERTQPAMLAVAWGDFRVKAAKLKERAMR